MKIENLITTAITKTRIHSAVLTGSFCLLTAMASSAQPVPQVVITPATAAGQHLLQIPDSLAWDADTKESHPNPGELTAHFTFYVTNVSAHEIIITNLQRGCGCTDAKMPEQPWRLAPGTNGPIEAAIDLRGKVPFVVIIILVMLFVLISFDPSDILLIIFGGYVISGPVMTLWGLHRRRRRKRRHRPQPHGSRSSVTPPMAEGRSEHTSRLPTMAPHVRHVNGADVHPAPT